MKRVLCLMLSLLLVLTFGMHASAEEGGEEEGSEGVIHFLELEETLPEDFERALLEDTPPFIPEGLETEGNQIVLMNPAELAEEEKTILDGDDRVTVKNTRAYPYSAIALMQMKYECGCSATGTGYMVDSNKFLTAAHCMICSKHNKWAKKITFNFGYLKGRGSLYKYTGAWEAYSATTFPNGYTDVNDWAYVRFAKPVGDTTGWFGRSYRNNEALERGFYYATGYRDGIMKYDYGRVRVMDANRMWVDMDLLPGNSGSPIYDSDYYAVGIWTTYYDNANSGIRLTTTIKEYVNSH